MTIDDIIEAQSARLRKITAEADRLGEAGRHDEADALWAQGDVIARHIMSLVPKPPRLPRR